MPTHALPPAESRARNRARRRRDLRRSILVALPALIAETIVRDGIQAHARLPYYLIAVPVCAAVTAAFAVGGYAASRVAAVSVTRRPRWLYGLAAVLYGIPLAILARIAPEHMAAHIANDNSWAAIAGGILALLCALGAVLMLGRAVVPGRWRPAFWLFPPLWLDKEFDI